MTNFGQWVSLEALEDRFPRWARLVAMEVSVRDWVHCGMWL